MSFARVPDVPDSGEPIPQPTSRQFIKVRAATNDGDTRAEPHNTVAWWREVAMPPVAARSKGFDPASVLAFCAVFALVLFLPQILNDGDTLWQIRTGEWILAHHAIPATDPFSFTAGDRPWFAHEWLAETLMAFAWRAAGMPGVMALAAAATGLAAAIVLRTTRRFLPGIYAVVALIIAFANAAPSLLARPHLLAWPCLVLWCSGLVIARANRTAPSFLLLPVMLIWVNLHGSFIIGLGLAAAFLLETLVAPIPTPRPARLVWVGFVLAACAVSLINPEGLSGVLFPIHMVGMKGLAWVGEWQPTDFGRVQPLELMILAGLALGLSGKVTLPPVRLLMLLGLIHGALAHGRNEQLLGLVGVLILAEPLGAALARGHAEPLTSRWRGIAAGATGLAVIALIGRLILPLDPDRTGAAFAAALDHVPSDVRTQPVLNDYSLGGSLIFLGVRPFIDSRADLYGDAFLTQYRAIVAPDLDELEKALAYFHIAWTIFPSGHRINPLLDRMPGWRRLIEADGVVIHLRQDPARAVVGAGG